MFPPSLDEVIASLEHLYYNYEEVSIKANKLHGKPGLRGKETSTSRFSRLLKERDLYLQSSSRRLRDLTLQ